jgi:hypothetical protein
MDGNDYIQSIFATERHRQFDREVDKDRLARLASPRLERRQSRGFARWAWALVRSTLRRDAQRRVQRAPMSIR